MSSVIEFPHKTQQLKHKKKKNKRFYIFIFLFVLWAIILIAFTPISEIMIDGNDAYSADEIIQMLGLKHKNYAYYRFIYRVPGIEKFPYLDDVAVEMKGRKLLVHVVESKPCLGVEHMFGIIYISSNGKVLEFSKEKRPGVAIINGLNIKSYVLGEIIAFDQVSFTEVKHLVDIMNKYKLTDICKNDLIVNFFDLNDIVFYYNENLINIGDTKNFDEKIAVLSQFITQNPNVNGSVDVSDYQTGIIYKENNFEKNVDLNKK